VSRKPFGCASSSFGADGFAVRVAPAELLAARVTPAELLAVRVVPAALPAARVAVLLPVVFVAIAVTS
jgi:hypothetical protein